MNINIKNFKCYTEKSFYFKFDNITLLKGISGKGKTTILNSIYWCLYGELNNVYPNNEISTNDNQTIVEISFEALNIKIKRVKPPEILELTYDNKVLLNDSAQCYINDIFGNYLIFTTSSYISQGSKNPLLTVSTSEKFNILRCLVFDENSDNENPLFYIQKLDILINSIKDNINTEIGYCNALTDNYKKKLVSYENNILNWGDYEKSLVKLEFFKTQLKIFVDNDKKLNTTLSKILEKETCINMKKKQLEDLIEKENNTLIIDNLKELEIEYNTNFAIYNKINTLSNTLNSIYYLHKHDNVSIDDEISNINLCKAEYEKINKLGISINDLPKIKSEYKKVIELESAKRDKYLIWEKKSIEAKTLYDEKCKVYENEYSIECDKIKQAYIIESDMIKSKNLLLNQKYNNDMYVYKEYILKYDENEKLNTLNKNIIKQHELEKKNIINILKKYENDVIQYGEFLILKTSLDNCHSRKGDKTKAEILLENIKFNKMLEENICPHCEKGFIFNGNTIEKGNLTSTKALDICANIKINNELLEIFNTLETIEIKLKYINVKEEPINPNLNKTEKEPILYEIPILKVVSKPLEPKYLKEIELKLPKHEIPKPIINEKEPPKESEKLSEYIENYEILKLINVPSLAESEIENELRSLNNKSIYKTIEKEINDLKSSITIKDLNTLNNIIITNNNLITLKNTLSLQISEFHIDELPIPSSIQILNKITDNKNNSDKYENIIDSGIKILELEDMKAQIAIINDKLKILTDKLENTKILKKIISEIEYSEMEIIIKNINSLTNIFLNLIFEEDISICLSTNKLLKSNKTKNAVNIRINYKGYIFENINELSYGEQIRISLCLTLAINKLNSSNKLILLDEIFSSLNSSIHENIIDLLKTHFSNKCIINICHNIVDGFHDDVIEL